MAGLAQPEPPPQPPEPEGPWEKPFIRAVLAHSSPEEHLQLAELLLMALAGDPPNQLLSFVRGIATRLTGEPKDLRKDLGHWLRQAAHRDYQQRMPFLYNFLIFAELPGFEQALHFLRGVDVPGPAGELLQAARDAVPIGLVPPPEIHEGMNEAQVKLRVLVHQIKTGGALIEQVRQVGGEVSAKALSWLWMEASDLAEELKALDREMKEALGSLPEDDPPAEAAGTGPPAEDPPGEDPA